MGPPCVVAKVIILTPIEQNLIQSENTGERKKMSIISFNMENV